MQFVPKEFLTKELCNDVLNKNCHLIEHIPKEFLTMDVCSKIVSKHYNLIKYVPKEFLTVDLCQKVFDHDKNLIKWIPEEFYNDDMKKYIDYINSEPYINEKKSRYDEYNSFYANVRNDDD